MERPNKIVMILILANQNEAIGADSTAFGVKPRNWVGRRPQLLVKKKESYSSLFHRKLKVLIVVFT